ncbi:MAG: hypothetical protein WA928_03160 [Castellaniella sp.]
MPIQPGKTSGHIGLAACLAFADRFFQARGTLVCQMAVDNQNGMNHAGNPKQTRQKNVQEKLHRLAAKQNGHWRQNDRKKITH